jgi:hypothetical protein
MSDDGECIICHGYFQEYQLSNCIECGQGPMCSSCSGGHDCGVDDYLLFFDE